METEIKFSNTYNSDVDLKVTDNGNDYYCLTVGKNTYISGMSIDSGAARSHITIGRYTSISKRVVIEIGLNHDHHLVSNFPFRDFDNRIDPYHEDINHYYENNHYHIIIGNDVWIGEGVRILGGVHIGNGAVIGMGAVVTKDIPPYAVAVGNPARVVKYRFNDDTIAKLEQIKWWNWDDVMIQRRLSEIENPEDFSKKYCPDNLNADETYKKSDSKIFYFVVDSESPVPIWDKVVVAFENAYKKDTSMVLLLEVPVNVQQSDNFSGVNALIDRCASECPGILKKIDDAVVDYSDLIRSDVYIAGTDIHSLSYIDQAESNKVEIRSACDWESGLFEKTAKFVYLTENKPLVSICIPTYNRSAYLKMTIDSLICQPEFQKGMVEIVISDNCSTDDTETVGKYYANLYDKIRYFRNKENVHSDNFQLALSRGSGILRKLNNDTAVHRQGSLAYICYIVRKYNALRPVIQFGNIGRTGKSDVIMDLDHFLLTNSFYTTWIGAFTVWDDDSIDPFGADKDDGSGLWQVEKLIEMSKKRKSVVACNEIVIDSYPVKKDYEDEMWQIFYDNFFDIVGPYISENTRGEIEKDLLFNHFGYYLNFSKNSPDVFKMNRDGLLKRITEHYKDKPYWNEFVDMIES